VPTLHVLRVFTNDEGEWGNPLGVFLDGAAVPEGERQRVAADLGFSETVFIDDAATGELRLYTPATELPFAGHPMVGTAWLLAHEGTPLVTLRPPAGPVATRVEDGLTFIAAEAAWSPEFEYRQLAGPDEVHALTAAPPDADSTYPWAWIDESAGTIRARMFAPRYGVPEDEATGSAALALSVQLDRPVTIHQGHGSVLIARPLGEGRGEVGGGVALDETRDYQLAG
jgi:predicted PhzF superfamily epimerase YddE/YHI9